MKILASQSKIFLVGYKNMNINVNELLPKDLRSLIKKLQQILMEKENSKSIISDVIGNERDDICCPRCNQSNIAKDGLYKGRQKYECKECGKKFNALTNTPFHHTRLTYNQIEVEYQCLVEQLSIRKTASKVHISTRTAFTNRFKIISCLKSFIEKIKLSGEMELDEYYLSINLKGTKAENMPRASKKRNNTKGNKKRGISNHKVCIVSGVDENDNTYFKLAGTGSVTSDMIEDTIATKISNPKRIKVDCKSSYEKIAKDNNWNLIQIKSQGYADKYGNNLANINSLHSELTNFLSKFHGVSTKHLQEYLDWFVFYKYQTYCVEYLEQGSNFEKNTITQPTNIKYNNVCENHSILDFVKIYEDYDYHPSNSTT